MGVGGWGLGVGGLGGYVVDAEEAGVGVLGVERHGALDLVQSLEFRVSSLGLGFRVWGLWLRV